MEKSIINKNTLIEDLKQLGIQQGDILNVKVSLKSVGFIEGGVTTLIDALLDVVGENGTIFADAFVKSKILFPLQYKTKKISNNNASSYAGAFANAMIRHQASKRSPHPIQKFVAIGKHADIVLKHNVGSAPYSVLHEMCTLGAKNLRIGSPNKVVGVGTTHVAIDLLDFKQNILRSGVDYIDKDGTIKTFLVHWPTGCRKAFNNLLPIYKEKGAVISEGFIGEAPAMLTDMQKTLDIELELGKTNPDFVMCNDPACYKCQLTWKHSKGKVLPVLWKNLKKKKINNIFSIIYLSLFKNVKP